MTATELENPGLVRDLKGWDANYDEIMDAWRTYCLRLTVWDDALDASFIAVNYAPSAKGRLVSATEVRKRFRDVSGMSG
ncbi:MAG: hypothetical protein P8M18_04615 [Woeseiaceae bacterium]|nr:hypothetical protein [Woeseiaceae bacterium]